MSIAMQLLYNLNPQTEPEKQTSDGLLQSHPYLLLTQDCNEQSSNGCMEPVAKDGGNTEPDIDDDGRDSDIDDNAVQDM
jgi:hypothetical protein